MIMSKIILITGGARSGKSKFAERLAKKITTEKKIYIATAQVFDEEMEHRIKIHQSRRGEDWLTIESPFKAEEAINQVKDFKLILFDCLTIYLSNFICSYESLEDMEKIFVDLKELINRLIVAMQKFEGTIIIVTNEVGSGIVPENKLARVFRDCAGLANQMIAEIADEVYLTVAGISINVKNIAIKI